MIVRHKSHTHTYIYIYIYMYLKMRSDYMIRRYTCMESAHQSDVNGVFSGLVEIQRNVTCYHDLVKVYHKSDNQKRSITRHHGWAISLVGKIVSWWSCPALSIIFTVSKREYALLCVSLWCGYGLHAIYNIHFSHQIFLKFCTRHYKLTTVLFAKYQNGPLKTKKVWTNEILWDFRKRGI